LALRNILLNGNYIVKIADFGLSRQTRNGYYSRKSRQQAIPLFWAAPEVLRKSKVSKVLLESDLWTFGVVLWELFKLSGTPYENIDGSRKVLLEFLDNGHRLTKPEYSPSEMLVRYFPTFIHSNQEWIIEMECHILLLLSILVSTKEKKIDLKRLLQSFTNQAKNSYHQYKN
jgi:serine/threonine protein kinase